MESGYGGDVYTNSYGKSDTAYSVVVTISTGWCGGNEVLTVNWRDYIGTIDPIYYLYKHGYNCSGGVFYNENNKYCTINDNNEAECEG
jgi:hypothetical protein